MNIATKAEKVQADFAELRRRLATVLKIREEDLSSRVSRSQPLYVKLQVAAYALEKTGSLPSSGIAELLGKRQSWVNFATATIELRTKNELFDAYVDKVIEALTV